MVVFPNAKINLGLNIIEKRSDGFHNIESCFYPIDWKEALEAKKNNIQRFTSSGITIPESKAGNLCDQAYQLLAKDFNLPPTSIHLLKKIPIGAGLGGGSADGAFMLKLLNEQYQLNLNTEQLKSYASKLGSDCPFFIENKPVLATETGVKFQSININIKGLYIYVVHPGLHISTAEAYANIKPHKNELSILDIIQNQPIQKWRKTLKNDFENSLFPHYPILSQIKESLYSKRAIYASMTGSGSAIFGLFEKRITNPFPHFESYGGYLRH